MIREVREYYCRFCSFSKILGNCEEEPKVCPACGGGNRNVYTPSSKEVKKSD